MGYHQAGFEVVGVDINHQKNYPFEFHQADALEFLAEHGHEFDVVAGSPPCQLYSWAHYINQNEHPDLVEPTRELMIKIGKPYIIENVVGAPLINPVELCGAMFGLRTYRHRIFESNLALVAPQHPMHVAKVAKMGRRVKDDEYMHIVGNFTGAQLARDIMEIDWMVRDELSQAIPPAYTRYLGEQVINQID